jgi:hypothetical protein
VEAFDTSEPIEVEAVRTALLVLVFITAPSELDAVATVELVFPFTTAATELDAVCTSLSVASEPVSSPAPVRVRVPAAQMSAAMLLPEVSVRVAAAHTFVGIDVIDVAMPESVDPREVEAVSICALVLVFMTAASEDVAVVTVLLVFALIAV